MSKILYTKTDKRILNEKLQKYRKHIDSIIDTVSAYPPNRIPARTKQNVIGRHTRTLRAINRLLEDLNKEI